MTLLDPNRVERVIGSVGPPGYRSSVSACSSDGILWIELRHPDGNVVEFTLEQARIISDLLKEAAEKVENKSNW